jgi:hypothetical protein
MDCQQVSAPIDLSVDVPFAHASFDCHWHFDVDVAVVGVKVSVNSKLSGSSGDPTIAGANIQLEPMLAPGYTLSSM